MLSCHVAATMASLLPHCLSTECRRPESSDLQCIIPLPGLPNWAWEQRTWVMGILNVTPDSFSDGGQVSGVDDAVAHACTMVQVRPDV